jgi:glycosyltransferase involved in cell wall biosynthesis
LDREIFYPSNPLVPKGKKPRILLEGAIEFPFKGMEEAFEAVKGLDAEVWCVSSDGKPKPDWKCDRFFEKVPMLKMKEIYSSCDILLKLSRVEGFFGPPLEMMACGGARVVGKVTGHDEYIVDGENALVVSPTDIDSARQAVQRLISDQNLLSKLRTNGLKTASGWDWEASVDILEKYFYGIVDGKYGYQSDAREMTNLAVLNFQKKLFDVPITPYEIVLRKIGNSKLFQLLATPLFHFLIKFKNLYKKFNTN